MKEENTRLDYSMSNEATVTIEKSGSSNDLSRQIVITIAETYSDDELLKEKTAQSISIPVEFFYKFVNYLSNYPRDLLQSKVL